MDAADKTKASWEEAFSWRHGTRKDVQGQLSCVQENFKEVSEMTASEAENQCFCEEDLPKEVEHCANEGEDCWCRGTVLYGR